MRWHWHATGETGYHRINSIGVALSRIRFRQRRFQCIQYTMGLCFRLADNLGRGNMILSKGRGFLVFNWSPLKHARTLHRLGSKPQSRKPQARFITERGREEGGRVASLTSEHETGPPTTSVFRSPHSLPPSVPHLATCTGSATLLWAGTFVVKII